MARVKISEFRAKNLLKEALRFDYTGVAVDLSKDLSQLNLLDGKYVVKVDQAVKKRNKLGLVKLNRTPAEAIEDLRNFAEQGYNYALVEPFFVHEQRDEHFVAMSLTDEGVALQYSPEGGVEIEENKDSLQSCLFSFGDHGDANTTALNTEIIKKLLECFEQNQMTYLEINPLVIQGGKVTPLDAAVEVDSSTEFGSKGWTSGDYRSPKKELQPVEQAVEELASKTPASLVLKVLNPDGNLFLLLSGGGASVVILDEIATLANKDVIGNYGEYSGNPNEQDTYLYTKQVIKLMLDSKATKKALLIAGGVANFTDVAKTFKGIIRALDDNIDQLKAQDVHVVVRRGGPNQKQGLALMKDYLESKGLNSQVYGTEMSLGRAVQSTVQGLGL